MEAWINVPKFQTLLFVLISSDNIYSVYTTSTFISLKLVNVSPVKNVYLLVLNYRN